MTRPYRQQRRAKAQARTRQRIVEAAVELHQEQGVQATSFADIAGRAGVGKVTVYRHFADLDQLAGACSGLYFERHPFPAIEPWRAIAGGQERLRVGLTAIYAYHRETAAMMRKTLAEVRDHPVMAPYHAHWREAAQVLAEGVAPGSAGVLALVDLAIALETWVSLTERSGLDDVAAIQLMLRAVMAEVAAGGER